MTKKRIGLVLQGGGALGAYECGAIKALYKHYPHFESKLHVVSGVSVGAFNATVLVGAKEDPVSTLEEAWRRMAVLNVPLVPEDLQPYLHMMGVPGMCYIRPSFLMAPLMVTSMYNTSPMLRNLANLVDVERINSSPIHLIVTAVDIETGELIQFENKHRHEPFTLEMALASGSIEPAFAMTHAINQCTGKEMECVDGGFGSNLPLSPVINVLEECDGGDPDVEREVIVVQLIPMRSRVPTNMPEMMNRVTQLVTSSRLELDSKLFSKIDSYIDLLQQIDKELPPESEVRKEPAYQELMEHRKIKYIVINMTRPEALMGPANFSKSAIEDRIECGYEDTFKALEDNGIIEECSDREQIPASVA